jgi:hypothetical protein
LLAGLASGPATADTLDDVLKLAADIGMIDADVVRSKPLIECLIGGGNAVTCAKSVANVQEEALSLLPPTDSNIKLIVDLVQAVADERWLKVIELTGKNGITIACKMMPGGKLRDFFCSGIADVILNEAKAQFEAVYYAITEGDWWRLVTLIDPAIVCKLLPGEIKVLVCDGLLQAIGAVVDIFEDGVGVIVEFFEDVAEIFTGEQDPAMSPDKFYREYWRFKNLHWMVNEGLQKPGAAIGVWPTGAHQYCVSYFDSHRMSEDDAKSLCQKMGDTLHDEAVALKKVAVDAVAVYLKASLLPRRYLIAADWWQNIPAPGAPVLNSMQVGNLYTMCIYEVQKNMLASLPPTYSGDGRNYSAPGSVPVWVCNKAVYQQFFPQLPVAKIEFETKILAPLTQSTSKGRLGLGVASQCRISNNAYTPKLLVSCATYEKWRDCRNIFHNIGIDSDNASQPKCLIDDLDAGKTLAAQVAADLGKRCSAKLTVVECTREWKVPACYARIGEVVAGLPYKIYQPTCKFVSTPAYEAAKTKASEILNGLNGAGPVDIGPGGVAVPTTVFEANKACYSLPDPLVLKCKGSPSVPDVAGTPLPYCKPDPNNDGMDSPCYLDLPDAGQVTTEQATMLATPPATTGSLETAHTERPFSPADTAEAPPNPCRMEVSYYVPQAPIVSVSSPRLLVNDQFQIQCSFKKVTREVEWPECDDAAQTAMHILALSKEAGGRYSGMVTIDGNTLGVSSSPEDGSDFASTQIWKLEEPGAHDVSCQVDNVFSHAAEGAPTFLGSAVSLDVSARSDGLTYRGFEPDSATTLPVRPLPSEDAPTARDGKFRMLQSEAPARRTTGPAGSSTATQPEFAGVRQSQGEVAMSNDWNDGSAATTLNCSYTSVGDQNRGGQKTFEIWAENTSPNLIDVDKTIHWRLTGSDSPGRGKQEKWTEENGQILQEALPIGAVVSVGKVSVTGTASGCEAWVP